MKNIIKYKEGENSYALWIKKRVKNNLNFLALCTGSPGVGKSWAMLSLAYAIDPTFSIDQVAFGFKETMQIINSDWFKKKPIKIIHSEETQTQNNARAWQSLNNRLFNYLISTFRHQNIIFLMTTPYADFIDSATMKLVHCNFEVKGHSEITKKTIIRPKLLQYNASMKKFYNHSLMVMRDNTLHKLKTFSIGKPPEELIRLYEIKKKKFTDELNKKILFELDAMEKKNDHRKPLTPLQEKIKAHWDSGTQKQRDIARLLNKSYQQINENIKFMKNKGFCLEKEENQLNKAQQPRL